MRSYKHNDGSMKIREMTKDDYRTVFDMLMHLYDEHAALRPEYYDDIRMVDLEKLLDESDLKVVAEDDDGKIVGFARGKSSDSYKEGSVTIHDVFVEAPLRGKGVGSLIMHKIYALARASGISSVRLQVDMRNAGAVAFWENEGFEVSHHKMIKKI